MIAERVDLRYFLTLGMLCSAIFCYLFGLARTYSIHHISYYILIQVSTSEFECIVHNESALLIFYIHNTYN